MALNNTGQKGSIDHSEMARIMTLGGSADVVETVTALKVSAVTGSRQVAISAGTAYTPFCRTVNTSEIVLSPFAAPTGSAWHLIVLRRRWTDTGIISTVETLAGPTSASQVIPLAMPADLPALLKTTPGGEYDQELAWAWVRQNSTEVILFDLRALGPSATRPAIRFSRGAAAWDTPNAVVFSVLDQNRFDPPAIEGGMEALSAGGFWSVRVPISGFYHLTAFVPWFPNASGQRDLHVNRNNTEYSIDSLAFTQATPGTGVAAARLDVEVPLNGGDVLRWWAFQNCGGFLSVGRRGVEFWAADAHVGARYVRPLGKV